MKILELRRMDGKYEDLLLKYRVLNGVSLISSRHIEDILKAFKDEEGLSKAFDIIGVKYDRIEVSKNNRIRYTVDNNELALSDLSSGERYILYLMACKILKRNVVAKGLLERLGNRLTEIAYEQLHDYEGLILINCNRHLPSQYRKHVIN